MVNKFNKQLNSIKTQELAITKKKNKRDDLLSNVKVPSSVKKLENSLKSTEKEIEKLEEQYQKSISKIQNKEVDLEFAQGLGDSSKIRALEKDLKNLDIENMNIASQLEEAREKSDQLQKSLQNITLDTNDSVEIQQLNSEIDIMNSKLEQTKFEANQTADELMRLGVVKLDAFMQQTMSAGDVVKRFGEATKNSIGYVNKKGIQALKKFGKYSLQASKYLLVAGARITKGIASKIIGKRIGQVNDKLGTFKNKLFKLVSAAAIFNVIRSGLTSLKNGFFTIAKANDTFSKSLAQIKGNLMTAFAPIYSAIMPALNNLMSGLVQVTATIAQFTASLFGTNIKQTTKDAKKLSGALKDTSKSGEEASGSLADFDHLQVIGNSSGGDSGGNDYDYSKANESNSKLLDIMNKLKDLVNSGDWGAIGKLISDGIVGSLNYISEKIKSLDFSSIGKNISDFLTNIDYSGILTGIVSVFGEATLKFQDLLLNIDWGKLSNKLSTGIKDGINKIGEYISQIKFDELGENVSKAFTEFDWSGIIESVINTVSEAIGGIGTFFENIDWGEVGSTLGDAVSTFFWTISDKIKEVNWSEVGQKIFDAIWDFFTGINWIDVLSSILSFLINAVSGLKNLINGFMNELWTKVLEFFGVHSPSTLLADFGVNLMTGLINGLKSMVTGVINVFSSIWSKLKTGASTAWTGIKNVFSKVGTFFQDTFSKAWTKVKNVFSTGGKIFNGIKDGIVTAFKKIVNSIIDGINKVVKVPFDGINTALGKIKNISILGNKPFKGLIKDISVPKIPHLAKGAVIPPRQEFAAILGDQKHGTNIETPASLMADIFDERLAKFFDKFNSLNNDIQEIVLKNLTFVIQLGAKDFKKIVMEAIRLSEKELGRPLFVS